MRFGQRLVFTSPLKAGWEEIAVSDELPPYHIAVSTRKSLISAGTELAMYRGSFRFPCRPGYSLTGEICAVGDRCEELVPDIELGAHVFLKVPHQSISVVDIRKAQLIFLPQNVSDEQALLSRLASISMAGIRAGAICLGDSVAVFGLGLIGQLAAQLARIAGARPVFCIDRNSMRREVAEQFGAIALADGADRHRAHETGELRVTTAIEATGNAETIPQALKIVKKLGRLVLLGSTRGTVVMDPYMTIHRPGVHVIGAHEGNFGQASAAGWTIRDNFDLSLTLFLDGSLKTERLISDVVPSNRALMVHDELQGASDRMLGVVIDWR